MRKYLGLLVGFAIGLSLSVVFAQTVTRVITIPSGEYVSNEGVVLRIGEFPTQEPDVPTVTPVNTEIPVCAVDVLKDTVLLSEPAGTFVVGLQAAGWTEGLEFYYTLEEKEFIKMERGWIAGADAAYDLNSYCAELPVTFENPLPPSPTPQPTVTPPVITPVPTVQVRNALQTCIRIRSGPGTEYTSTGSWCPDEQVIIDEFKSNGLFVWGEIGNDRWTAVAYTNPFEWWVSAVSGNYTAVPGWQASWPVVPFQ